VKLYAWLVEEEPGEWNIIGAYGAGLDVILPLVTSKKPVAAGMEPLAKAHGQGTRKPVRLATFTEDDDG